MGANSAIHAGKIANNLTTILSIELMAAAQAIDFRLQKAPESRLGRGTAKAYSLVRTIVPFFEKDAYYKPALTSLTELVRKGAFSKLI